MEFLAKGNDNSIGRPSASDYLERSFATSTMLSKRSWVSGGGRLSNSCDLPLSTGKYAAKPLVSGVLLAWQVAAIYNEIQGEWSFELVGYPNLRRKETKN